MDISVLQAFVTNGLGTVGVLIAGLYFMRNFYEKRITELREDMKYKDTQIAGHSESLLEYQKIMIETSKALEEAAVNSAKQAHSLQEIQHRLDQFILEIKNTILSKIITNDRTAKNESGS